MKRKERRTQIARVQRLADKWIKAIGLGWWTIDICYYDRGKSWRKTHAKDAAMTCSTDWRYRSVTLDVDLRCLPDTDDAKLERWFVHELAHIFLAEMVNVPDVHSHAERVAQTLADALIWARQAGARDVKDHADA